METEQQITTSLTLMLAATKLNRNAVMAADRVPCSLEDSARADLDSTIGMTVFGRRFTFRTSTDQAEDFFNTVHAGQARENELQRCRDVLRDASREKETNSRDWDPISVVSISPPRRVA